MDIEGFTLDVYMQRAGGQDYWDGIYDPIPIEEQEARVAEANKRRELTRNLKQRLAYLVTTRWPATPPGDTWKIGCAVRSWLVGEEHAAGDSEAGKMPLTRIVEMLGGSPAGEFSAAKVLADFQDDVLINHVDVANALRLEAEPLRKRLDRWRNDHKGGGWQEVTEPKARQPKYLYQIGAIRSLLQEAIAGGETSA